MSSRFFSVSLLCVALMSSVQSMSVPLPLSMLNTPNAFKKSIYQVSDRVEPLRRVLKDGPSPISVATMEMEEAPTVSQRVPSPAEQAPAGNLESARSHHVDRGQTGSDPLPAGPRRCQRDVSMRTFALAHRPSCEVTVDVGKCLGVCTSRVATTRKGPSLTSFGAYTFELNEKRRSCQASFSLKTVRARCNGSRRRETVRFFAIDSCECRLCQ